MTNELVPINEQEGLLALLQGASKYSSPEVKDEITKATDFLPILQVLSSNSSICISTSGTDKQVNAGQFGLRKGKDKYDEYGSEIIIMAVSWRPKAMIFSGPISYYDPSSSEYKEVKETADKKNSGKAFGPELLIWLPEYKKLCIFFLGSKTARNESDNILDSMEEGNYVFRLKVKLIRGTGANTYSWHGFDTFPHDLPISLPEMSYLTEQKDKFDNPPAMEAPTSGEEAETSERD